MAEERDGENDWFGLLRFAWGAVGLVDLAFSIEREDAGIGRDRIKPGERV